MIWQYYLQILVCFIKMPSKKICLFLLLGIQLAILASSQKLIMIQELFRHGARYPVYPHPGDGSEYTFTEHSFGELTTNGKKMHYLLGQKLYNLYWSQLFAGTPYQNVYNQSRFYIKSSDVNRTIESVQSQMAGILENLPELQINSNMTQYSNPQWPGTKAETGPVFPNALKFHPIAIHVEKEGTDPFRRGDFLRAYSPANCPNQDVWKIQNQQSPRLNKVKNNQNFLKAVAELSKEVNKTLSIWDAATYYDNYFCAKYLGKSYLSIFNNSEYRRSLEYIHTIEMYTNLYLQEKQIRATATGFFNATVRNIKNSIEDTEAHPQWISYSAHDTTVGNMLAAMNMTNVECIYQAFLNNQSFNSDTCVSRYPEYASSLIFELYEPEDRMKQHFFKVRYNGEIRPIPFCSYKNECSVSTLYEWYDDFKDEHFLTTCGISDQDSDTYFSIAVAEFGLLVALAIGASIGYLKKNMNRNQSKPKKNDRQRSQSIASTVEQNPQNTMVKESLLSEEEQKGS